MMILTAKLGGLKGSYVILFNVYILELGTVMSPHGKIITFSDFSVIHCF